MEAMIEISVNRRRYTYSAAGRLETETVEWFDSEGAPDRTLTIRYDPAGREVEKELKHAGRPYSCRWTYRYDTYGNLAEETKEHGDEFAGAALLVDPLRLPNPTIAGLYRLLEKLRGIRFTH